METENGTPDWELRFDRMLDSLLDLDIENHNRNIILDLTSLKPH